MILIEMGLHLIERNSGHTVALLIFFCFQFGEDSSSRCIPCRDV